MPARPYRPSPRLYRRFAQAVKDRGLSMQAVADSLEVSRSHLYRVLTDPAREGSALLWQRITPYLQRSA